MNVNSTIRKYFVDKLREFYPIFDKRQGTNKHNKCYLIVSQSKNIEEDTKCGSVNFCTIEIEILQRSEVSANVASTFEIDEMELPIIELYNNINFVNFALSEKSYNENSFNAEVSSDNINRKVIVINFKLWKNE